MLRRLTERAVHWVFGDGLGAELAARGAGFLA
jgi:hypothetical protein